MRQVKNILATLLAISLASCMLGIPVAFGAEESASTTYDATASQPSTDDQDSLEQLPAVAEDSSAGARDAQAFTAAAADTEGFRSALTQAWLDMTVGPIDLSQYHVTLDEANEIWREIQYDNPTIFWDGEGYWRVRDGYVTSYENDWAYSKAEVDAMMAAYEAKVDEALSWTSQSMSDWDKAVALHDYLVRNCTYQYGTASDIDYSAYGILVNGTGRCAAYAKAYQDLLSRVGIEAEYVIGTANGGSHAWNHVKLDGTWYAVDVTYDDACYLVNGSRVDIDDYDGTVSQKYLLKSDVYMAANGHQIQRANHSATDTRYDYGYAWPTYTSPAAEEPLFGDVSNSDWFVADGTLDYVVQNGLMMGNGGLFRPYDSITRAEFATILWRFANHASAKSYNSASARNATAMADVQSGAFYTEAANWCAENGVITGAKTSSGTLFQPNRAVTREEAVVILVRFAELQGADAATTSDAIAELYAFSDFNECSDWAVPLLASAHENGIISGSGNCLRPQSAATRCEAAALLKSTANLIES